MFAHVGREFVSEGLKLGPSEDPEDVRIDDHDGINSRRQARNGNPAINRYIQHQRLFTSTLRKIDRIST